MAVNPNLPSRLPPLNSPMFMPVPHNTGVAIIDGANKGKVDPSTFIMSSPWRTFFTNLSQGGASAAAQVPIIEDTAAHMANYSPTTYLGYLYFATDTENLYIAVNVGSGNLWLEILSVGAAAPGVIGSEGTGSDVVTLTSTPQTLAGIIVNEPGNYLVVVSVPMYHVSLDPPVTADVNVSSGGTLGPQLALAVYPPGRGGNVTFNGSTVSATTSGASATITINSGYGVQPYDIGRMLYISGGTDFITGMYFVASVNVTNNTWTLNATCSTGSASGMVGIANSQAVETFANIGAVYAWDNTSSGSVTLSLQAYINGASGGGGSYVGTLFGASYWLGSIYAVGPFNS